MIYKDCLDANYRYVVGGNSNANANTNTNTNFGNIFQQLQQLMNGTAGTTIDGGNDENEDDENEDGNDAEGPLLQMNEDGTGGVLSMTGNNGAVINAMFQTIGGGRNSINGNSNGSGAAATNILSALFGIGGGGLGTGGGLGNMFGEDVKVPLKISVIEQLPLIEFNTSSSGIKTCPVCYNDIQDGEQCRLMSLCCKSYIHRTCTNTWWDKQHTCASCGKNLHDLYDQQQSNDNGNGNDNLSQRDSPKRPRNEDNNE